MEIRTRTLRIRKFDIIPHADIFDSTGAIIGEWTGAPTTVFRGSLVFPVNLAEALERAVPQEKLDALKEDL